MAKILVDAGIKISAGYYSKVPLNSNNLPYFIYSNLFSLDKYSHKNNINRRWSWMITTNPNNLLFGYSLDYNVAYVSKGRDIDIQKYPLNVCGKSLKEVAEKIKSYNIINANKKLIDIEKIPFN